jgi:hypothetical protein
VANFLVHLGVLLVEFLSFCFSRHDFSFHFFDLVVKYKFEFLELLGLGSQVVNSACFFLESDITFSNFLLLRLNLLLQ